MREMDSIRSTRKKPEKTLIPSVFLRVDLPISLISSKVIDSLSEDGDEKDEAKRSPVGIKISDLHIGNELRHRHQQEIQIEEESELLEEYQRQERQNVIFLQERPTQP
jgi:hypothetical protein